LQSTGRQKTEKNKRQSVKQTSLKEKMAGLTAGRVRPKRGREKKEKDYRKGVLGGRGGVEKRGQMMRSEKTGRKNSAAERQSNKGGTKGFSDNRSCKPLENEGGGRLGTRRVGCDLARYCPFISTRKGVRGVKSGEKKRISPDDERMRPKTSVRNDNRRLKGGKNRHCHQQQHNVKRCLR